ncbi:DUF2375 domain-containing protein [Parashewanella curva]|uniref:DUF2375 domain-containing protein n=1 Tax=Parashewanella curva TaxID=2338552 RepID=A0A3L8PVU6_9GAMM|nr:DUF2375 family protein [Parashewanella curva]RLV59461.1 DUF2375 domain-containing protein [Parashewanella curva]
MDRDKKLKTKTVTVLYYSELANLEIKAETLKNLPYQKQGYRVKLPDSFKSNKIIIAVLEGEVQLLNFLGERAEKD